MVNRTTSLVFIFAVACTPGAAHKSDATPPPPSQAVAQSNTDPGTDVPVITTPSLTAAALKTVDAPSPNSPDAVRAYLQAHLPAGGSLDGAPLELVHTVNAGDTYKKIASDYLALTEVYAVRDLTRLLEQTKVKLTEGARITIPRPLTRVPGDPKTERLGWPEDKVLRGVFVTGSAGQRAWEDYLNKLAERSLNIIVLDGRDYQGPITYPTKAKLAVESGAAAKPVIPDLARMIRFAHWKGIRVAMRIPCFHDPWTDKRVSRVTLKSPISGAPVHFDWIDPTNEEVQNYVLELVREQIDAGADEIQLDYVRFPVHLGELAAKLPKQKERSYIIRDFVKRVHDITEPAGVMLSLDLFGVAATGSRDDIEKLGQDITIIGPGAEAISPMAYPSHYSKGYNGWDEPGDHAEIIGIANKAAIAQIKKTNAPTVVRAWLQAFPWRSPHFGPPYIAAQAKFAESSGGHGWLMWSPDGSYGAVWQAIPKTNK